MSFNAIRENKILAKISEFTVYFGNIGAILSFIASKWILIESNDWGNFIFLYFCGGWT